LSPPFFPWLPKNPGSSSPLGSRSGPFSPPLFFPPSRIRSSGHGCLLSPEGGRLLVQILSATPPSGVLMDFSSYLPEWISGSPFPSVSQSLQRAWGFLSPVPLFRASIKEMETFPSLLFLPNGQVMGHSAAQNTRNLGIEKEFFPFSLFSFVNPPTHLFCMASLFPRQRHARSISSHFSL